MAAFVNFTQRARFLFQTPLQHCKLGTSFIPRRVKTIVLTEDKMLFTAMHVQDEYHIDM